MLKVVVVLVVVVVISQPSIKQSKELFFRFSHVAFMLYPMRYERHYEHDHNQRQQNWAHEQYGRHHVVSISLLLLLTCFASSCSCYVLMVLAFTSSPVRWLPFCSLNALTHSLVNPIRSLCFISNAGGGVGGGGYHSCHTTTTVCYIIHTCGGRSLKWGTNTQSGLGVERIGELLILQLQGEVSSTLLPFFSTTFILNPIWKCNAIVW